MLINRGKIILQINNKLFPEIFDIINPFQSFTNDMFTHKKPANMIVAKFSNTFLLDWQCKTKNRFLNDLEMCT